MQTIAQDLRKSLHLFPQDYLPEVSYTIEEVVGRDCYGLFEALERTQKQVTVVDIGANFGIFSYAMALAYPEKVSRHIAVEPVPSTFRELVRLNTHLPPDCRYECCCHAFGDGRTVSLRAASGASPFKNQVGRPEAGDHLTYAMSLTELFKQYGINGPVLLKIDCEGGESALLYDMNSITLLRHIVATGGAIGLEVHWGDKYPNLSGRGVTPDQGMWRDWLATHFIGSSTVFHHVTHTTANIFIHG